MLPLLKGAAASAQAKTAAAAPVRRSALVTARAPARKQHQAFKGSRRTVVRTFAAAEEAAEAPKKIPLTSLKTGDEFEGVVTKVEQFGAFVSVGAEKDGLVHISQLADGFVKAASEVVKAGDTVKVRVLSVDPSQGRFALTMKSGKAAAAATFAADDDDAVEVEEESELAEGQVVVFADAEGSSFPFIMEEMDGEITLDSVAAFENAADSDFQFAISTDLEVPLGELITGKVTRIEEYGLFVEFSYNGKNCSGLLERDEAKVPSSALSKEELAALQEEDDVVPQYVTKDIENLKTFYKIGDEISAIVLEYNEDDKIGLTQYADWEVDADALDEDEAEDEGEVVILDPMAIDPLALLEDDDDDDEDVSAVVPMGGSDSGLGGEMQEEYGVTAVGAYASGMFTKSGDIISPGAFPSRPLDKVNTAAINSLTMKDTDFDGDEIELEDFWQQSFHVPKDAMKKLGYKMVQNEKGDVEVVEREGVEIDDSWMTMDGSDHDARVAAFVADLLDEDEDEDELPRLAMRRPAVLAMATANISAASVKQLRDKTGAGMMDCKKALAENDGDAEKAMEWLRKKGLSGADKKAGRLAAEGAISSYIHPGSRLGVLLEVNCETDFVAASDKFQQLVGELGMIIAASPEVCVVNAEDVPPELLAKERDVEMGKEDIKSKPEAVRAKIVEGRIEKIKNTMALVNQMSLRDPTKTVSETVKETIAAVGENIQIRRFSKFYLGEGLEKRSNDFAAEVAQQTQAKAAAAAAPKPKEDKPKEEPKAEAKPVVQVAASVVKELRDKTGAGMMDCKKALGENGGDMEAAVEWLRKKGLAGADKKAGRLAAEGVVARYIHPGSRLGVLLEVNCETDFVAASEKFNQLVNGIAMQIAASPQVSYVRAEDIPAEVFQKEKEIEMGREDLKSKPDAIRAKIAEGRVQKLAQDMALMPQAYLMDPSKTVEEAVKEAIAAIGEKISIRRFVKFQLGEGLEKRTNNLAAEVAAATGQK